MSTLTPNLHEGAAASVVVPYPTTSAVSCVMFLCYLARNVVHSVFVYTL
jgi:hypothetical protein